MGGQQGWFTRQLAVGQHSVANIGKLTEMDVYTVNIDPGAVTKLHGSTTLIAAAQAALGDFCLVAAPVELEDITATAYVLDAGNIELCLHQSNTATDKDFGAGDWKVLLIKAG